MVSSISADCSAGHRRAQANGGVGWLQIFGAAPSPLLLTLSDAKSQWLGCFSVQKTGLFVGNALTAIRRFIYARLHD